MATRTNIDFIPGGLAFRIDHEEKLTTKQVAEKLKDRYMGEGVEPGLDTQLPEGTEFDPDRVLTFDRGDRKGFARLVDMYYDMNQAVTWAISGKLKRQPTRYFSIAFTEVQRAEFGYDCRCESQGDQDKEPVNLTANQDNHNNLISIVNQINRPLDPLFKTYRVPEAPGHQAMPHTRIYKTLTHEIKRPKAFDVQAANFNWMSTAAQAVPTGGPGSRPQHPDITAQAAAEKPKPIPAIELKLQMPDKCNPTKVDIFILDTLSKNFEYGKETAQLAGTGGNTVAQSSTPFTTWANSAQGRYVPYPADLKVPKLLPNPGQIGNFIDWLGSDGVTGVALQEVFDESPHGLFVADILCNVIQHSGVDVQADIHLVEVLSKWGSGTMETVARGLHTVHEYLSSPAGTKPTIINCSFTLQIPRTDSQNDLLGKVRKLLHLSKPPRLGHLPLDDRYDKKFQRRLKTSIDVSKPTQDALTVLEPIFELLRKKALIVAAAGNDRRGDEGGDAASRPIARYPAAYGSVIGVAALNKKNPPIADAPTSFARYSNRADDPSSDGFAVYGGSVIPGAPGSNFYDTDTSNSLEGFYAGNFPDGTTGEKAKWRAFWSGTSFAAPIITGALAVFLSCGMTLPGAVSQLKASGRPLPDGGETMVEFKH